MLNMRTSNSRTLIHCFSSSNTKIKAPEEEETKQAKLNKTRNKQKIKQPYINKLFKTENKNCNFQQKYHHLTIQKAIKRRTTKIKYPIEYLIYKFKN